MPGFEEFFEDLKATVASLKAKDDGGGNNDDAPVVVTLTQEQFDQFSAMGERVVSLEAERETYKTQAEALAGQVSALQVAREVDRFSVIAEGFAHLPSKTSDLASHLLWLNQADKSEDKAHYGFFSDLLGKANELFAAAFKAEGDRGVKMDGNIPAIFSAKVTAYMKDHEDVTSDEALSAVMQANRSLYNEYREQIARGKGV